MVDIGQRRLIPRGKVSWLKTVKISPRCAPAGDAVLAVDRGLRIMGANEAACKTLGPELKPGRVFRVENFFQGPSAARAQAELDQALSAGKPSGPTRGDLAAPGRPDFPCEYGITPLFGPSRQITGGRHHLQGPGLQPAQRGLRGFSRQDAPRAPPGLPGPGGGAGRGRVHHKHPVAHHQLQPDGGEDNRLPQGRGAGPLLLGDIPLPPVPGRLPPENNPGDRAHPHGPGCAHAVQAGQAVIGALQHQRGPGQGRPGGRRGGKLQAHCRGRRRGAGNLRQGREILRNYRDQPGDDPPVRHAAGCGGQRGQRGHHRRKRVRAKSCSPGQSTSALPGRTAPSWR